MFGIIFGGVSFLVVFFFAGAKIIRPVERGVVETLGRYTSFVNPGFRWIFPGIQRLIKINITEKMADIDPQEIITYNRLNAIVDLVVYYKIRADEDNVKKALYNVNNVERQIIMLAKTTARSVIGELIFEDVNSKRKELNEKLCAKLDVESDNWGVEVVRVELKEIQPPQDVQETMNNVIKAENKKAAAEDFASAMEIEADGQKRAAIKVAEGKEQGAILEAEGKAQAFEMINKAFVGNAQILKQLEVTETSLKDNMKVILTDKGINPQLIIGEIPVAGRDFSKR